VKKARRNQDWNTVKKGKRFQVKGKLREEKDHCILGGGEKRETFWAHS